jgi:hypothetical protein
MKRLISILTGTLAILIGIGMIMPALAKAHSYGLETWPLVTGMLISVVGVSAVLLGILRRTSLSAGGR